MSAEREQDSKYTYTLTDRLTDFWHSIHPPAVWVDIPVTKTTTNEQGFHQGDVVGSPSFEDCEPTVRPARIVLDARKSGDVFTNLDLGYCIAGGDIGNLQRVLPGYEEEISLAIDEVERKSNERVENPDPESEFGRWLHKLDERVDAFKREEKEAKKLLAKGREHSIRALMAAFVGSASFVAQPLAGIPFYAEFFRQMSISGKWREKYLDRYREMIAKEAFFVPTREEVEEEYQASRSQPLEKQLTLPDID